MGKKIIWTRCDDDVHEIIKQLSEDTTRPMAHIAGELLRDALNLGPAPGPVSVADALAKRQSATAQAA